MVDIKEFFKAGDLHVTDTVSGDRGRFDQMGAGAQRTIQMALIRYLADVRRAEDDQLSRRLLLIDEPELYLHPQGVRRLRETLKTLSSAGFQVVFSTHSPLMLSRNTTADETQTADAEFEVLREEAVSRGHELINDKIQGLDPEEMEELTAALLRAMGYQTRASARGPDRGVDVLASDREPLTASQISRRCREFWCSPASSLSRAIFKDLDPYWDLSI